MPITFDQHIEIDAPDDRSLVNSTIRNSLVHY
jgi:hypothetical protein